jgi:hypothetical protein
MSADQQSAMMVLIDTRMAKKKKYLASKQSMMLERKVLPCVIPLRKILRSSITKSDFNLERRMDNNYESNKYRYAVRFSSTYFHSIPRI